jgi:PKD repeat protein
MNAQRTLARAEGRAWRCGGGTMLAALVLLLATSPAASAAGTWLGPNNLSSLSAFSSQPDVAADAMGDAVAVWQETGSGGNLVEESTHPPDGGWQTPVQLASDTASGPFVVLDATGDAAVAWASASSVEATERAPGQTWQSPVTLGSGGSGLQLSGDARGDAIAVWVATASSHQVVEAAVRPAGDGWQPAVQISPSADNASNPQVALDADGNAVAVWQLSGGPHVVIQAAERPVASGVWQSPVTVSNSAQDAGPPTLAVDPQDDATALWAGGGIVQSADRPAGQTWESPVDISAAGGADPELAVDSLGDATAVFDQTEAGNNIVAEAAQRPAGGAWAAPVAISGPQMTESPEPRVALDARGDAVAIWNGYDGSVFTVQAATRRANGAWQPAGSLSGTGVSLIPEARVATDPQGDAAVIWSIDNGTTELVQAEGYDDAGPIVDAVSIPSSGTVGVPVSFSVAPVDAWSAVAGSAWSFGDGASDSGQTLSHTYARAGSYPVTVTSTDTLGNATTTTGTIAIIVPPSSPMPKPPAPVPAPSLTHLAQTHRTWREGTRKATIATRVAPVGTTFLFATDQHVRVTLAFAQSIAGRRVAGMCRAPTRGNRRRPACHRTVVRGSLSYVVTAGSHRITFQGLIANRRLPLGAYTLSVTATSTTTSRRSATRTLRFTIVR